MKVIELELNHLNFYNPANGTWICSEEKGYNLEEKSFIGYWVEEVLDEPFVKDEKLLNAWKETWMGYNGEDTAPFEDEYIEFDEEFLDNFLENYEHEGWFAFKIITGPEAGGPFYEVAWLVLNLFE